MPSDDHPKVSTRSVAFVAGASTGWEWIRTTPDFEFRVKLWAWDLRAGGARSGIAATSRNHVVARIHAFVP